MKRLCKVLLVILVVCIEQVKSSNAQSAPTGNNVLCLYRANFYISKQICDYYSQKRPGAHELGLNIPDSAYENNSFTNVNTYEDMSDANFVIYISQPLLNYVSAHQELNIIYIAASKDIPLRVTNVYSSAVSGNQFLSFGGIKYDTTADDIIQAVASVEQSCISQDSPFSPNKCKAMSSGLVRRFAVSYVTGFNLNDVKTMLDKAQKAPPDLTKDKWLIDLDSASALSGQILNGREPQLTRTGLQSVGIDDNNIIIDTSNTAPLVLPYEIVAYIGLGSHHISYGPDWISGRGPNWVSGGPASVNIPVSNRAIINVYESFFGVTATDGAFGQINQGRISQALEPDAFGGSNYSRSFSGGVGTVWEPKLSGTVKTSVLLPAYARGRTFAESFMLASFNSPLGMAVGDPLMRLYDQSLTLSPVNRAPIISSDMPSRLSALLPPPESGLKAILGLTGSFTDDGLPSGSYLEGSYSKVSGPGNVSFEYTSGVNKCRNMIGNICAVSASASFDSAGTYVIRFSVSDSDLVSRKDITVTIGQVVDSQNPRSKISGMNANNIDKIVSPNSLPISVMLDNVFYDPYKTFGSKPSFVWRKTAGPNSPVHFSSRSVMSPTVTFDEAGLYTLRLDVTDSDQSFSGSKDTLVLINKPSQPIMPVIQPQAPAPVTREQPVLQPQPNQNITITPLTGPQYIAPPVMVARPILLSVIAPTSGQSIVGRAGSSFAVRWSTQNWDDSLVDIDLVNPTSHALINRMGSNQPNNGSFTVNINSDSTVSASYQAHVYSDSNPGVGGYSGIFTLNPAPTITPSASSSTSLFWQPSRTDFSASIWDAVIQYLGHIFSEIK